MDDEVLAWDELHEVADEIRQADAAEKKAKAKKESLRGAYFALISEIVREEVPLAKKTVVVEGEFDLDAWRAHEYPEWRVVSIDNASDDEGIKTKIVLEENEDFKKFEFVHDGYKYGRQIRMKGAGFDTEAFWKEIDEWFTGDDAEVATALAGCVEKEVVTVYSLDEAKAMKVMADYPETVTLFQKHTNPGTPEPALLPIRVAKEEDE